MGKSRLELYRFQCSFKELFQVIVVDKVGFIYSNKTFVSKGNDRIQMDLI